MFKNIHSHILRIYTQNSSHSISYNFYVCLNRNKETMFKQNLLCGNTSIPSYVTNYIQIIRYNS